MGFPSLPVSSTLSGGLPTMWPIAQRMAGALPLAISFMKARYTFFASPSASRSCSRNSRFSFDCPPGLPDWPFLKAVFGARRFDVSGGFSSDMPSPSTRFAVRVHTAASQLEQLPVLLDGARGDAEALP